MFYLLLDSIFRSRSNRYNSRTSRTSLKSNASSDSYVSAVSFNQANDEDEADGGPAVIDKPFVDPGLLSAYKNHMQEVTCINWRQNVSSLRKKFSLLKNLKVLRYISNSTVQLILFEYFRVPGSW